MSLRNLAIDFDSFFASVEQQERPELRGQPVGVAPLLAELEEIDRSLNRRLRPKTPPTPPPADE